MFSLFRRRTNKIDVEPSTNYSSPFRSKKPPFLRTSQLSQEILANYRLPASQLEVLPQIDGTCWFNAILMAFLYSEGLRKIIIEQAFLWTQEEIENDRFKKFVIYVLKYNYSKPEKIRELFKKRFKTSSLLLSLLSKESSLNVIKQNILRETTYTQHVSAYGYYSIISLLILSNFLKYFFGELYLSIKYENETLYLRESTNEIKTPKIIFVYDSRFCNDNLSMLINITYFNEKLKDEIKTLSETITFNGNTYKLDALLASNVNKEEFLHLIAGITYRNKPYVYNGWTLRGSNEEEKIYKQKNKYSCPLFSIDWKKQLKIDEPSFCLTLENCETKTMEELEGLKKIKYCFNFSKKTTTSILIYVLVEEQKENEQNFKSIAPQELQFTSRSLSSLRGIYHGNLKNRETGELFELLQQAIMYTREELDEFISQIMTTNNYSIFYFMLTNSILQQDKSELPEDALFRKVYLALLKEFIDKNKVFKLSELQDDNIFKFLTIKQLRKILLKKKVFIEEHLNALTSEHDNKKEVLFELLKSHIKAEERKQRGGYKKIIKKLKVY